VDLPYPHAEVVERDPKEADNSRSTRPSVGVHLVTQRVRSPPIQSIRFKPEGAALSLLPPQVDVYLPGPAILAPEAQPPRHYQTITMQRRSTHPTHLLNVCSPLLPQKVAQKIRVRENGPTHRKMMAIKQPM